MVDRKTYYEATNIAEIKSVLSLFRKNGNITHWSQANEIKPSCWDAVGRLGLRFNEIYWHELVQLQLTKN